MKTGLGQPWLIAVAALVVGAIVAVPFLNDRDFYRALVATYIGAVIGFLVALYIDRLQRSEDAVAERDRNQRVQAEEEARQAELVRSRRVVVLTLLREELGRVPQQMGARQNRTLAPSDVMTDILWRSLTASGELHWIQDLDLLQAIATAYDLLALEIDIERRWSEGRRPGGGVEAAANRFYANELTLHDRATWNAACAACRAMDRALVADGANAGSNSETLFCP